MEQHQQSRGGPRKLSSDREEPEAGSKEPDEAAVEHPDEQESSSGGRRSSPRQYLPSISTVQCMWSRSEAGALCC